MCSLCCSWLELQLWQGWAERGGQTAGRGGAAPQPGLRELISLGRFKCVLSRWNRGLHGGCARQGLLAPDPSARPGSSSTSAKAGIHLGTAPCPQQPQGSEEAATAPPELVPPSRAPPSLVSLTLGCSQSRASFRLPVFPPAAATGPFHIPRSFGWVAGALAAGGWSRAPCQALRVDGPAFLLPLSP